MKKLPSAKFLRECFELVDTKKGSHCVWKVRPLRHFPNQRACNIFNSLFPGTIAGTVRTTDGKSYYVVKINTVAFFLHRVMWKMRTGKDPGAKEVDHIDGKSLNNKPENHRLVTTGVNLQNKATYKNNTSSVVGVYWHKGKEKWDAKIGLAGKLINLGSFEDKADAIAARRAAELDNNFHSNHGRKAA